MLRRNRALADEDGPPPLGWIRRNKKSPVELGADPKRKPSRHLAARLARAPTTMKRREATMTVSIILAGKGREVVTIEPGASLADAARVLAEKRIGAALILGADSRLAGIISERDIVRALAARGAAALSEPVSQSMTRKVETCTEGEAVANIMERMTVGKFRHMPVVDQGRVIGIVSIGDIVKHRLREMEHDSTAMRDYIMTA
jgi:CBS domain-containing protein